MGGLQARSRSLSPAAGDWLFVSTTPDFGGHETMLLRWMDALDGDAQRVRPHLLARLGGRLWDLAPLSVRSVPLAPRTGGRWALALGERWREWRALRRAVLALRPECVVVASGALHFHWPQVLALRLMGQRVLLYVPLLGTFASMGYRWGRCKDGFVRALYARVPSAWIAITEDQAETFRAWARPAGPVFVLPNTVAAAIEQAPRVPARPLSVAQPLRVLVLGRLDAHQKGLDMLLAHLAQASALELAGLHFRIVGDGSYRAQIAAQLRRQPQLARHVELQAWMSACVAIAASDVLLLPSRYEGVPLVMLEAMALGVPVVSADLPGTRPYVADGARFAVGDMPGAMAILHGLRPQARRQALAQAGRASFEAQASGQAFAGHVQALVQRVRRHFAAAAGGR